MQFSMHMVIMLTNKIGVYHTGSIFGDLCEGQWQGFDVSAPVEEASQDPDKIGLGLGIVFMRSLMDKVEYKSSVDQGTEVVMIKKLSVAHSADM